MRDAAVTLVSMCMKGYVRPLGTTKNANLSVEILLDTGATVSTVSPELATRLQQCGAKLRHMSRSVFTPGNSQVHVSQELDVVLTLGAPLPTPCEVQVTFYVMDTGSSVLLSASMITALGLLELLPSLAGDAPRLAMEESSNDAADIPLVVDEINSGKESSVGAVHVAEGPLHDDIVSTLGEYSVVFGSELCPEGADTLPMTIDLIPGQHPKSAPPRRQSEAIRQIIAQEVDKMLTAGIVRPSTSTVASPVVIVRQKDKHRFCVDYTLVNQCTQPFRFPLPNLMATLQRMAGKAYYATLDLRSGYHQVRMHSDAIPLTAFMTMDGLYEYMVVPFGLKNAPAFFQQVMQDILHDLVGISCEVYIDDIIVYGTTAEEFMQNLRKVLDRLMARRLRLRGDKCHIGLTEVTYLGHIVNGDGISMSDKRKEGLLRISKPKNAMQVRSFFGLANYFRAFVPQFSVVTKPLTTLCSSKTKFIWTEACDQAFLNVKDAILNSGMLYHIRYDLSLVLRTDASTLGIGAMLLNVDDDGNDRPIWYLSHAFTASESKWSTIEQEAFAIFFAITSLSHFLLGHDFVIETDHRNLMYLHKAKAPKIERWKLRLQEYTFTVRHIPGKVNPVADCLSRCLAMTSLNPHIEDVHNSTVGHHGVQVTLDLLKGKGEEWPTMREDVIAYIKCCPTCQKVRLGQPHADYALHSTEVHEPFEVIAIDTIGPLPEDEAGNKYIITVIDCFTRFVELRATPGCTAMDASRVLLDVFGRYGAPYYLRSDSGPQFVASMISEFLKLVGTERQLTIAYHPQSNGIVERQNAEVMRHLKALVFDKRINDTWSIALPLVQRIINATPSSGIGIPPARLLFGDMIHLDRGLVTASRLSEMADILTDDVADDKHLQLLLATQQKLIEISQEHQSKVIAKRKSKSPKDPTTFAVGEYVLVSYPGRPPNKLVPRWRGPLMISEVNGNVYTLLDLNTGRTALHDISHLKKYETSGTRAEHAEIASRDKAEFIVESIIEHAYSGDASTTRKLKTLYDFKVRWKDYGPEEDSWIPYSEACKLEALDRYVAQHPELESALGAVSR